jgi:hypothetical protein
MKNFWLPAAILTAVLSAPHPAAAFSTEQVPGQNSDGTPKFADPDEQMPGFVTAPGGAGAGNSLSLSGAPVTIPTQGEYDNGARAFDQAFSHQQDR